MFIKNVNKMCFVKLAKQFDVPNANEGGKKYMRKKMVV